MNADGIERPPAAGGTATDGRQELPHPCETAAGVGYWLRFGLPPKLTHYREGIWRTYADPTNEEDLRG